MPRKKTKKVTNKAKSTMKKSVVDLQKMESDFVSTPSKLAALISKDIEAQKQKIVKLQSATKKAALLRAMAEKRLTSASNKKQLKVAKQSLVEVKGMQAAFAKQLTQTTKLIDEATAKQAKMNALGKALSQFEKDWKKQAKLAKAAPKKTVATKKKKATIVKIVSVASPITSPVVELNSFESDDMGQIRREGSTDA